MWIYKETNGTGGHHIRAINMDAIVAITLYGPDWEDDNYIIHVRTADGVVEKLCSTPDQKKALKKWYRLKELLGIKGVTL